MEPVGLFCFPQDSKYSKTLKWRIFCVSKERDWEHIQTENTAWLNHTSTTFSAQMHFPIFLEVLHLSKNSCFLSRLKQLSEPKDKHQLSSDKWNHFL